jgi:hypothetical protein
VRTHVAIRGLVPLVFLAFVVCAPRRAAAAQPPTIAFDGAMVRATGITRGGKVAWFGVGHLHEEAALHIISRHGFVVDTDGDGEVSFEIAPEVPVHSVWIAVDMESGELAVASPEGHELRLLDLPPNAIHPGVSGGSDVFEDGHRMLQVVVVRPRSGAAWGVDVADGGSHDGDGEGNGRLKLPLEALTPLEGSPELRPAVLTAGDIFVAIALDSLETYAAKLPVGRGQN